MTVNQEIRKSFNKYANAYDGAAKVQCEIGRRLLERLDFLNTSPKYILDLGCGPGNFSKELVLKYPKAHIIGLDMAQAMLQLAQKKQSWRRRWSVLAADMQHMPFPTGLFDLVFANQVIHWSDSLPHLFREINRVMNVNACFMFTTLGPDTFKEINLAWSGVNSYAHTNLFRDMHDIGDLLMTERFLDPVMDMEQLAIHYETLPQLVNSLKSQGVKNINPQRNSGLTGRKTWQQFEKNYHLMRTDNEKYPLSYEVVYGHAWKGEQRKTEKGLETIIPITSIQKR